MALPVMERPLTLTDLVTPTVASANAPAAVPARFTLALSAGNTPERTAVPVRAATAVPS